MSTYGPLGELAFTLNSYSAERFAGFSFTVAFARNKLLGRGQGYNPTFRRPNAGLTFLAQIIMRLVLGVDMGLVSTEL